MDAIMSKMEAQSTAWNDGDINGFMEAYWDNDSLIFIGSKGITYGHSTTLENYKNSYDSKAKMGKLTFLINELDILACSQAIVKGQWELERDTLPTISGYYTLHWKKLDSEWVIVYDHTS